MVELKTVVDLARAEIQICVCVSTNINLDHIRFFESSGDFLLNTEANARSGFNIENINTFAYVVNNQLRRSFMFAGGGTTVTAVVTLTDENVINSNSLTLNQIHYNG